MFVAGVNLPAMVSSGESSSLATGTLIMPKQNKRIFFLHSFPETEIFAKLHTIYGCVFQSISNS